MKKVIVFLIFFFIIFFVSGEKLTEFDNIFKPRNFQVAGDDLYIVDGLVIKLFSMKDFKFITQFGKKGEGPGEFKWWPQIMIFADHIAAASPGKISFFSRNGQLIKEKKYPKQFNRFIKVKENYITREIKVDRKEGKVELKYNLFDSDLNFIKTIFTYPEYKISLTIDPNKKPDNHVFPEYLKAFTDGENVFVGDTTRGFYIEIFNDKGVRINTIKTEHVKLKTTKKNIEEYWQKSKRSRDGKRFNYIYPEFYPAYKKIFVNKKKIYAITYKTKEDKQELIILDMKGNVLKQTYIPEKRYYNFCDNKYYYFVDNEGEEVMEFHSIDL